MENVSRTESPAPCKITTPVGVNESSLKVDLHGALYTQVVWAIFNIMVLALFIARVLHIYSSVGVSAGCIAGCKAGSGVCSVPVVR